MVAIVVPISNRPALTADEEISLRHLRLFLHRYDKFVIAPKGLKFELPGFRTRRFSQRFFGSRRAHGRLLYRPGFYKGFEDYKYILMHHLDALAFSDELEHWCGTDVDYIGAPFVPDEGAPEWMNRRLEEPRVGSGGFALMKVEAVIKVLRERYRKDPAWYWVERLADLVDVMSPILPDWFLIKTRELLVGIKGRGLPNDIFWTFEAVKYVPAFRIADWKTGLRFAFNNAPRRSFELNERKLPFGCHGWPHEDRAFWESYLIKE